MSRRTVPVAYVTKWAATRGILVVRNAERSDTFPECIRYGGLIHPKDWTENKAEAEKRWFDAMDKARAAALRRAASITKRMHSGPEWEEP